MIKGRLLSKVFFHQRMSSVKGCFPSKVVFRQRLSSSKVVFHQRSSCVKGRLPSKVIFHQRSSFVKCRLPSNVVIHQMSSSRSSSIKGCFLSKVVFRQRSSSIEGRLPSKVVFHWRSSSSFGSFLFLGFSPECGIAQLSLPLFVFSSESTTWRQQTVMQMIVPKLHCQLSPDSNQLQCLRSCQYTWLCCAHCLCCVYTCTVHWLWLYSCLVSESSNYKLGRLDKKKVSKSIKQSIKILTLRQNQHL